MSGTGGEFGRVVRAALKQRGMTIRAAARAISYDHAYLSRVLSGKQIPSPQFVESLDRLLDTGGGLVDSLNRNFSAGPPARVPEQHEDIPYMRAAMGHLLDHDNRYGADHVATAAVQVWRAGQRKLDGGIIPGKHLREYLDTVAELAEVAGWLLFEADRQPEARAAIMEAQVLARQAGNRSLQWFTLDLLSMHAVHNGAPGEVLRISDEFLSARRLPPRVALLARVRRSRALAQAGDRTRALAEIGAARSALQESVSSGDPEWTWWVTPCEISGHEGEVFLELGEAGNAIEPTFRALEMAAAADHNGRRRLSYGIALFEAYAKAQAWRDCESILMDIAPVQATVKSARNRARLRSVVRGLSRDGKVPVRVVDLAREVESAA